MGAAPGLATLTRLAAVGHHVGCLRLLDARHAVPPLQQRLRVAAERDFREATVRIVALPQT